ncbi:MAG: hypothetical protein NZ700_02720 [Gemmataceae bacterium]|nr:hypothetical protein [Gemmataceae bacterium]MDW8266861.1 hypothetical protein [Gemmataceae bacterium]
MWRAWCLTAAWLVWGAAAAAAEPPRPVRAGAAAVDISPRDLPVNMPGGFAENIAEKVHDPLHARALILDDGTTRLALVVVDNVGVGQETAEEIKSLASRRCGIVPERILLSATHSHSCPPANVVDGPPAEVAYRKILIEGTAEAIARAAGRPPPGAGGGGAEPPPPPGGKRPAV